MSGGDLQNANIFLWYLILKVHTCQFRLLLALAQVTCLYEFIFTGTSKSLSVDFQMHLEFTKPCS